MRLWHQSTSPLALCQHALPPFLYECFYISVLGFAVKQD